MSIEVIGKPFSTFLGEKMSRSMIVVCHCNECNSVFYTRFAKTAAIQSCGCMKKQRKSKIVECMECGELFEKSESEIKQSPNHFCDRSCAAKFSNKNREQRKKIRQCKSCNIDIYADKLYCDSCGTNPENIKSCCARFRPTKDKWFIENLDKTLAEIINTKGFRCNAFTCIRGRARTLAKAIGYTSCCICGYELHVEVAHIKPICDYPLDTKVSEVNNPKNLAPLCPNCHWEFDNKYISLEELTSKLDEFISKLK